MSLKRLPLHRVDEILCHFDAGLGVRATARATGHAPRTVSRYRRLWRSARHPYSSTFVCRVRPTTSDALHRAAAARREAPSLVVSRLVEAIVDHGLSEIVLA